MLTLSLVCSVNVHRSRLIYWWRCVTWRAYLYFERFTFTKRECWANKNCYIYLLALVYEWCVHWLWGADALQFPVSHSRCHSRSMSCLMGWHSQCTGVGVLIRKRTIWVIRFCWKFNVSESKGRILKDHNLHVNSCGQHRLIRVRDFFLAKKVHMHAEKQLTWVYLKKCLPPINNFYTCCAQDRWSLWYSQRSLWWQRTHVWVRFLWVCWSPRTWPGKRFHRKFRKMNLSLTTITPMTRKRSCRMSRKISLTRCALPVQSYDQHRQQHSIVAKSTCV